MKQLITTFLLLMTVSPQAFASSHDLSSQDEPNLLVKRTGDVVLVADKFNKQYDIVVAFKKCMANELMTFQRVYLAKNSNLNVNFQFLLPTKSNFHKRFQNSYFQYL